LGFYENATLLDGNNSLAKVGKVKALVGMGNDLALKGEHSEYSRHGDSLASYDKALLIDPESIEALKGRGDVLASQGRFNESLEYYDKILGLDEENLEARKGKAAALAGMADGLYSQGRVKAAMDLYKNASQLYPDSQEALKGQVGVLVAEGDHLRDQGLMQDALKRYEDALAIWPESPKALAAIEQTRIALQSKKNDTQTADVVRQANERSAKDDYSYWLNRSMEHLRNGSFADALKGFNQSLEINPRGAAAWTGTGDALFGLGKFQRPSSLMIRP
jgi:tetratricopeptide (TPR) repeat protein